MLCNDVPVLQLLDLLLVSLFICSDSGRDSKVCDQRVVVFWFSLAGQQKETDQYVSVKTHADT